MRTTHLLAIVMLASACSDNVSCPPAPPSPTPSPLATTESKTKLATPPQIEARVTDREKAAIRRALVERDFVAGDINRDPFTKGAGQQDVQRNPTPTCRRADQFVASNDNYTDLRLVGILAEKSQRRALMIDSANVSHTVKKGDCVGREKAVVKDIGDAYVAFDERSVQLYP